MTQRGRAAGRPPAGTRPTSRPAGERARGDLAARRVQLRAVIEPVVTDQGYHLEDVSVSRAGRRHVVRVIVDAEQGINLDAVADVSRAVSAALDAAEERGGELLAGEYQLEVSSPGVDRPLTLPRHWRRNIGRLVRVTAGDRQVTGRVTAADDERVTLDVDGTVREFAYDGLGPGRVQVEFTRLEELSDEDLQEIEGAADDEEVEDEER
ncbi:ribosome maturation factor RimP [Micromonospora pattaloongensis]|uniref:Ribosome maturation factor RimP n=1 Tax=Micromonospora pattaloongensis TaxID=405436 RepID=A0A1H3KJM4_9ACTN|nr:ribosome maturation factor RimP [Micromonospora pattaloongensis]SDY52276.1 ribosome maturation factor RimP [Micromonospora pattaloongensis]